MEDETRVTCEAIDAQLAEGTADMAQLENLRSVWFDVIKSKMSIHKTVGTSNRWARLLYADMVMPDTGR
jgi:hypothetical protein